MFDVLLPFYGDPALLRLAVQSVLAQTFHDWRLTVLDDCYPDPSVREWCESIDDARVSYVRNEQNLGANRNYERALSMAEAEYVVVMGADDLMLPSYLEVVAQVVASHGKPAIVQPGVSVIDEDGVPVLPLVDRVKGWLHPRGDKTSDLSGEDLARSLLLGDWTYFPALCWQRETISRIRFRPEYDVVQDLAMLLDIVLDGGHMIYVPEVAFLYRRHAASDSGVRTISGQRFHEERALFERFADEMDRAGWPRAARAARLHLTSRLHAASLIPRATTARDTAGLRRLAAHAFGR